MLLTEFVGARVARSRRVGHVALAVLALGCQRKGGAATPSGASDTDLAADTDVASDSADTDPVPPGVYKVAVVYGAGTVSPGTAFLGTLTREVMVIESSPFGDPTPPAPLQVFCALRYSVSTVKALDTTAICPTCEFGFEVAIDGRSDLLPTLQPGARSDVSGCADAFARIGGLPVALPNRTFFFSSTYGGLYTTNASGALARYTDEVRFDAGELTFRKYTYRMAY